jgi:hypothetical protein
MTMTLPIASMRISRELASSELQIDQAVESSATLLATMARARIETGVSADTGQVAMMRLVRALTALTDARKDVIHTHSALRRIGEERADFLLPSDCPSRAASDEEERTAAAA